MMVNSRLIVKMIVPGQIKMTHVLDSQIRMGKVTSHVEKCGILPSVFIRVIQYDSQYDSYIYE